MQRWNGHRPKINLLLGSFYAYLVDQKLNEERKEKEVIEQRQKKPQFSKYSTSSTSNDVIIIPWIEKLLQTPICDHRKYAIRTIIAPYLATIKGLSYIQSFEIISDWLYGKCGKLERLNNSHSVFEFKIKEALNWSMSKNWRPLALDRLKRENPQLYSMITTAS
jgi:hypothetical protein